MEKRSVLATLNNCSAHRFSTMSDYLTHEVSLCSAHIMKHKDISAMKTTQEALNGLIEGDSQAHSDLRPDAHLKEWPLHPLTLSVS